ncbi:MAG: type II toxin-antitoxin system VapC family toxin [Planctomycetes bacterium]|nr:type II toxin-antitoxin system VapC family toxin [Planctomycetota bacterium]
MKPRYLLDTNVISEALRPIPDPGVMRNLSKHEGEMAIGAPVWHELLFGCARLRPSRRRARLEVFLREGVAVAFPILPYDVAAAAWHAGERARLGRTGRTPAFLDGQIAAIAAVHELALVSANVRDYDAFEGVTVVDWRGR